MYSREEIIYHYRVLLSLLDKDRTEASKCFSGEILDGYRQIIDIEYDILIEELRKICG